MLGIIKGIHKKQFINNKKHTTMTKEERTIQEQIRENERTQKRLSDLSFKQSARVKALETAQYMNPNRTTLGGKQISYDLIKESEKIYQWLIKVLK